ncbi:hypothetical protein TrispH2_009940 [Trichoplax sp. H2]|nr:hypothetical protein TrispH2_009940 [Trichoplax sp. H2]|eukprot:RDD38460.1 hypothetical protein TrispH2_009940 [Trichoplax sp. H2]
MAATHNRSSYLLLITDIALMIHHDLMNSQRLSLDRLLTAADKIRRHIEESNKKIMEAYKSGSISDVIDMYTEDCRVMPASGHILVGRDVLAAAYADALDSGLNAIEITLDELGCVCNTNHDTVFERGRYKVFCSDSEMEDFGRYVVIWKKSAGIYKIYMNIFTKCD